jgi:hypothetical protein
MRTFVAVAVALAGTLTAGAQQAAKPHNMTGCLQKTSDGKSFMLMVKGKKTVEFTKSAADLAPHVGHQIIITGTTDEAREKKEGSKAGHFMEVISAKMVAAGCPQ